MKRLFIVALAVLSVSTGAAAAKTVTMAVTRAGLVPKTVSISVADAVSFTNQDTQAHQLTLKPATGFACTAGLTLQPGQTSTCTFAVAGTYNVTESGVKGAGAKGTITVTGTSILVSLKAAPTVVTFFGKTTLSGSIATGQANQKVTISRQECGASSSSTIATVTTTTGGAFTYLEQPRMNSTYDARFKSSTSAKVNVGVRPRLRLRKLALHKFSIRVLAATSFAGKVVSFQRYVTSTGKWVRVRTVLLKAGPTATLPINPTATSRRTFRSLVKTRLKVRAVLTQTQAGSCNVAGRSNVIRS